jgi:hypothetical protein
MGMPSPAAKGSLKHECENFITWSGSSFVSEHKARCFYSIIKKESVIVFVFNVELSVGQYIHRD